MRKQNEKDLFDRVTGKVAEILNSGNDEVIGTLGCNVDAYLEVIKTCKGEKEGKRCQTNSNKEEKKDFTDTFNKFLSCTYRIDFVRDFFAHITPDESTFYQDGSSFGLGCILDGIADDLCSVSGELNKIWSERLTSLPKRMVTGSEEKDPKGDL